MKKKQNRLAIMVTVVLLCILVILSAIMVGCNRRDEGRVEAPDATDDVPEPEDKPEPEEDKKDEDKKDPEQDKESEDKEEDKKPEQPGTQTTPPTTGTTTPIPPSKPSVQPSKPTTPSKPNPVKYDDVVFTKAGTYSKPLVYDDGTVKKGDVIIKNKTFKGNVVIDEAVGKGDVEFENVIIEGTLYVYGGGSNSITLRTCTVNKMVTDRDEHTVRVVATERTEVGSILVKDDTILQEKNLTKGFDGFKNILVDGPKSGLKLSLKGLKLNKLTTDSKCEVNLDSRTVVNVFYADAATEITGTGEIEKLIASSSFVTYETKPNKIQTVDGAKRPRPAEDDDDDDDDDDWGSSDSKPTVNLVAVPNQTLIQKDSLKLSLNTNGSISAASSNNSVATVAVNGVELTIVGQQPGSATISVTASRSGYYSRTISFQVTVKATEKPVITITEGPKKEWSNQDQSIRFTVTDENKDIEVVKVNDLPMIGVNNTYTFTAKQNGKYTIIAVDEKGHESKAEFEVKNIDREPPKIEKRAVQNNIISFTVEDNSKEECVVTVTDIPSPLKKQDNGTYSFQAKPGISYTITAKDPAGNGETETVLVKKPQDIVNKLEIKNITVKDDGKPLQSKDVYFTVFVPADKQATVTITSPDNKQLAGEAVKAATPLIDNENKGYRITYTFTAVENGTYTIQVSCEGETAVTGKAEVKNIDRIAPAIQDIKVTGTVLSFTVTEPATVKVGDLQVTPKEGTQQYEVDTNATQTTKYTITATDAAGNTAQPVDVTVEVKPQDTERPVIGEISVPKDWAKQIVLPFTVTDNEKVETVMVTPDADLKMNEDGSYALTITANEKYTITARDAAGNEATKQVDISCIDTNEPEIKLLNNPSNFAKEKNITFKASDNGEIEAVVVTMDNEGILVTKIDEQGNYRFTAKKNGKYNITVTDKANNSRSIDAEVGHIDATAPAVPTLYHGETKLDPTAPEKESKENSFTAESITLTAKVTQKTDVNANNKVKAQYFDEQKKAWEEFPTAGMVLKQGEHTVQLRAIDDAGNVSSEQKYSIKIAAPQSGQTK